MKRIFTILGLALSLSLFAQSSDKEKAISYLNEQVHCNIECIVNPAVQDIVNADILNASLDINLGDKYYDASIYSRILLKSESVNASIEAKYYLFTSPEFIQALNPDFKLKTEEDGVKLRSLLFKFDDESRGEFFTVEDKWYFIKSEFFEDISVYVVSVDGEGNILNIVLKDLEIEKPETCMGSASNIRLDKPAEDYLSEASKAEIESMLYEQANYSFELEPIENKTLAIQLYNGELSETQLLADGVEASSSYSFVMLAKNDNFSVVRSKSKLFENQSFREEVIAGYKINTTAEAQAFQDFIDQFLYAEDEHKIFYKEDDIWVFVREESFGDLSGLLVSVNENGGIKHLDECKIDAMHMTRLRMKDENFIVDFAFKLEEPTSTEQTISDTEELPVIISFNAETVNAAGAWILTRMNGKDVGFAASTTMESPFKEAIPGGYLGKGDHTIEYLLIPSGQDTSNPLGSVLLNITVN
jgi:hypothetical protein